MIAVAECPAWVVDLKALDAGRSTGIWDLHPASSEAAQRFAADGLSGVKPGDTLWLAGGGFVEVQKVSKYLIQTSGGRFHRRTGSRWQTSWKAFVVAFRTRGA